MKKLFAFKLTAILFFTLYSLPIFGQSKPAAVGRRLWRRPSARVSSNAPARRAANSPWLLKKASKTATPASHSKLPQPLCRHSPAGGQGAERKMFLWDVYTFGPGAEIFDLKNKGCSSPCGTI